MVVLFKTYWSLLLYKLRIFNAIKENTELYVTHSKPAFPPVLIEMKRKINFADEEHDSENEESGSSDDESEDEEPKIKDVLSNLSNAVSKERASDLLHSMATSRDNLFWTPPRTVTSK